MHDNIDVLELHTDRSTERGNKSNPITKAMPALLLSLSLSLAGKYIQLYKGTAATARLIAWPLNSGNPLCIQLTYRAHPIHI